MTLNIPEFYKANVLVVGDVMLDRYVFGMSSRISPEAPVPVVIEEKTEDFGIPSNIRKAEQTAADLTAQSYLRPTQHVAMPSSSPQDPKLP